MQLIEFAEPSRAHLSFLIDIPGDIRALRISHSGRRLAVATTDGRVLTRDVLAASPAWHVWASGRRCRALAWSPDEERLAAEIDGQLLVGPQAGAPDTRAPAMETSDMVWWKEHTIALTAPASWPPITLHAPNGDRIGTLEPFPRAVGSHSPRLAVNLKTRLLAFSYVQDAVSVFEPSLKCRDVPPPTVAVPSTSKLTHHLQMSTDATHVLLASAPTRTDSHTEIQVVDLETGRFAPPILIPATAALAFGPQVGTGFAAPLDARQVIRWSASAPTLPFCATSEPIWGLELFDSRLWIWSRRRLALAELPPA